MRRRTFLSALLAAPAAARAPRGRVLIAGAGISGLAAAFELERAGVETLIVEAANRAGGRIRTLREPFAQDLYAEAGAVRIASHHQRVHHYLRQFGLDTEPFLPEGAPVYVFSGRRVVERPGAPVDWPLTLAPAEQGLTHDELWERKVKPALLPFAGANRGEAILPAGLREWDARTLDQFWQSVGLSPGARKLLAHGYRLERASALWSLLDELDLLANQGFRRIAGGNDRLPAAFATRLDGHILYGAPLRAVRHHDAGVEITIEQNGRRETLAGAALLCTLPLPLLREIEFRPALGEARRRLIEQVPYTHVSRVYLQTRRQTWRDHNLSGVALLDRPSQRFWPAASSGPQRRGILHTYTWSREALALDRMRHADRVRQTVNDAEAAFPGLARDVEATAYWSWQQQPWQRGAFAEYLPGQFTRAHELLPRPEGRVWFAGDHLSYSVGWTEGALTTAENAVRGILNTVRD
jgi:monoamine oxidase